jgi:endogenous inhibitor of DNA gyrase (YacG/DUF329 family)
MALVRCPTCSQPFDSQASSTMPFCSDRCRQIDLGRWLKEDISIPYREAGEDGPHGRVPDEDDDE